MPAIPQFSNQIHAAEQTDVETEKLVDKWVWIGPERTLGPTQPPEINVPCYSCSSACRPICDE